MAMFLSIAAMLEHLGEEDDAGRVHHAVRRVLQEGTVLSHDLGGLASTQEVARAVIDAAAGGEK